MELAPLQGKLKAAEKAWQSEREALEERASAAESALTEYREQIQALETAKSSIAKEKSSLHSDFRRLKSETEEKQVKVAVWITCVNSMLFLIHHCRHLAHNMYFI